MTLIRRIDLKEADALTQIALSAETTFELYSL
jgi:hypothetical protein